MLYLILFILEIILIFLLSKKIQRVLSQFVYRLTKNKKITTYIMAFFFLPGTFVHEVAHFLFALFLLVPVGNMQLIPEIEEGGVRLGSVSIAKTDPLRRFIIGAAPLIFGVLLIVSIFYFFPITDFFQNWGRSLILLYLTFTISNSMFSSKRDMEGLWGFIFVAFCLVGVFWYFGVRLDVSIFISRFSESLKTASLFLTIPIITNIICIWTIPNHGKT